jgi:phosphatidylinositol alpha-1,6-mannosyltransferase
MRPHLLLTYDFPPIGGGIARFMGEITRHYPPGSLIVSTGQLPDTADGDARFPNRVDRIAISARRLKTIQGLLLWSRRVSTLARGADVEFIWCGNIKPACYPAKWTRERIGVPYGVLVYGMDLLILQHQIHQSRLKRQAARLLLGSSAGIVAISGWTRDLCLSLIRELDLDMDQGRVRLVPLGTDPVHFRPGVDTAQVRERYGLEDGRWLLTVARLTEHKGIDTGIRVLAALGQDFPDLRYAVVGSGDRLGELEALARKLRVAHRVRFLTQVPDADLPALYNNAELYLGVSRRTARQVEGFGISLVEASACGLPVVGGRSGGIQDAVREGESGLLVDADDPAEVTAAVRRVLEDSALARRLGQGGRHAVETFYNWDRVVGDLRTIAAELSSAAAPHAVR